MDDSTIALFVALGSGLGVAAVFEFIRVKGLRLYLTRSCQGRSWRRAFPEASAVDVRAFLSMVTTSFGFRPAQGLSLSPTDALLAIYRACYPVLGWPDALELETFARKLRATYGLGLTRAQAEHLTLGEIFAMRPNNRMQATAGGLGVAGPARRAFARRT